MRQVRIQKRSRLTMALVAVMAASALLSAFQPASATAGLANESGRASASGQRGDFYAGVSVREQDGQHYLCAAISNPTTWESRWGCSPGSDVEVSDDLSSAWGRGTINWFTEGKSRGHKPGPYKYGSFVIDVDWTGYGLTTPGTSDPGCLIPGIDYDGGNACFPYVSAYEQRAATVTGTITDSEWGTFVLDGSGDLYQELIGT